MGAVSQWVKRPWSVVDRPSSSATTRESSEDKEKLKSSSSTTIIIVYYYYYYYYSVEGTNARSCTSNYTPLWYAQGL